MALKVNRTRIRLNPDYTKVIARFFNTGNDRSLMIIQKILQLENDAAENLFSSIFSEFSKHYKNIQSIFFNHFHKIQYLITDYTSVTETKKLLIGAYFTMEYSIEAAALFNPSIVEDISQDGAGEGEKKVIVSFRATGESHISSLIFKRGVLKLNGTIHFEPTSKYSIEGLVTQRNRESKNAFEEALVEMNVEADIISKILQQLNDTFSYKELEIILKTVLPEIKSQQEQRKLKHEILSVVNTNYELQFPADTSLSERIIFPVTRAEKNGIEDARFVKFVEEDGSSFYVATYTAYDGTVILPQLIITKDFCSFKVAPLHGKGATNKNLALFPRKINGQYVMLSRIDGFNNYIMFSDDIFIWEDATLLQQPIYPWEFVQIGNAGSPIETDKGWLVITHGVGAMRKYCLGASLFDINDPTIELGRLKEPLLMPDEEERDGYVPNVVYSCGSIVHRDELFLPYAVSDYASSFATIPLQDLLSELLMSKS